MEYKEGYYDRIVLYWNEDDFEIDYIKDGLVESKKSSVEDFSGLKVQEAIKDVSLTEVIVSEGVKRIDDMGFFGCDTLQKIDLPDSLELIGEGAFWKCFLLKETTIPKKVKKINKGTFLTCSTLSRVVLPESLEVIESLAFADCISLNEIVIPNHVKRIGDRAFEGCALQKVTLPDNLEVITCGMFRDCAVLEQVNIPKKLKKIENAAFSGCRALKRLFLPQNLEVVESQAFFQCLSLEEVSIPASVKQINHDIFNGCDSLKKVIFRYESYEQLLKFIDANENLLGYVVKYIKTLKDTDGRNGKDIGIFILGPKLTFFQKREVRSRINHGGNLIYFVEENIDYTVMESTTKNKYAGSFDEEIERSLDKIDRLCDRLPDESKKFILDRVGCLLEQYAQDKVLMKPQYDDMDDELVFGNKDIKLLKVNLLSDLEKIMLNLSSEQKMLDLLSRLNQFKQMLKLNVNELSEDNILIENKIKNILYLSECLDDKRKKEMREELNQYIDEAIFDVSNRLGEVTNFRGNLVIETKMDPEFQFNLNISQLYDQVYSYSSKLESFQLLLDTLVSKGVKNEFSDGDSIIDIVDDIHYVITKLSNSKYREEIEDKFQLVIDQYISVVQNIIDDDELLMNTKYYEIEHELRKELMPILELMNHYAYLDRYEEHKANSANLLSQLSNSLAIVNSSERLEMTDEIRLQPITSLVIELYYSVLGDNIFDSETIESIKSDLIGCIQKWITDLETSSVKTLEEYNGILFHILSDIVKVSMKIDKYLLKIQEYHKYIK